MVSVEVENRYVVIRYESACNPIGMAEEVIHVADTVQEARHFARRYARTHGFRLDMGYTDGDSSDSSLHSPP